MACARFEAAWREGRSPRIEEFLEEFSRSSMEQTRLMLELLALEVELRTKARESPEIGQYHERFPDHADVIAEVFGTQSLTADGTDRSTRKLSKPQDSRRREGLEITSCWARWPVAGWGWFTVRVRSV
jgi:hypothetical protein